MPAAAHLPGSRYALALAGICLASSALWPDAQAAAFALAPTGQTLCYDTRGMRIPCTAPGTPLGGQDAWFAGNRRLAYQEHGDGTVTDRNTGLMWQQELSDKLTWEEARAGAGSLRLGGYSDWRLPHIKELYSLMDYSGSSPMPGRAGKPFLHGVFAFRYGQAALGERPIDVQFWSADAYTGKTMGRDASVFGVNFADGRIKAYPRSLPGRGAHRLFVRYVRGNSDYGRNDFVAHGDGTISDRASGLMWLQEDSGGYRAGAAGDGRLNWPEALAWVAEARARRLAGHDDWRLPNAKELQSLVDYRRSPQSSGSAAIDPRFASSRITDEAGRMNPGFYWSSTSFLDGPWPGSEAVYVAFGEAPGWMRLPPLGEWQLIDAHGAGAQRSDPKTGSPADYPHGHGPQGDVRRIFNLVRLVRTERSPNPTHKE